MPNLVFNKFCLYAATKIINKLPSPAFQKKNILEIELVKISKSSIILMLLIEIPYYIKSQAQWVQQRAFRTQRKREKS